MVSGPGRGLPDSDPAGDRGHREPLLVGRRGGGRRGRRGVGFERRVRGAAAGGGLAAVVSPAGEAGADLWGEGQGQGRPARGSLKEGGSRDWLIGRAAGFCGLA